MTEPDYYYLKSLFVHFVNHFTIWHVAAGIITGGLSYAAVWKISTDTRRKEDSTKINLKAGNKKKRTKAGRRGRALAAACLAVYYYLLILFTLVFRPVYPNRQYHLELFWSYKRAVNGAGYLFYEIALNYILFMPLGMLVPVIKKKRSFRHTLVTGAFTSILIECAQLYSRRGLFEFDDIIGNVLGTVIGYGIYSYGSDRSAH